MGEQPGVREGVVEARPAERAEDREARRAAAGAPRGRPARGRIRPWPRRRARPGSLPRGRLPARPARASRRRRPRGRARGRRERLARAAVRRDDEARIRGPAGPGRVEDGALRARRRRRRGSRAAGSERAGSRCQESKRLRSVGRDGGVVWTPFAGMTRIRFRGSAVVPHSQRRAALPCPTLRCAPVSSGVRPSLHPRGEEAIHPGRDGVGRPRRHRPPAARRRRRARVDARPRGPRRPAPSACRRARRRRRPFRRASGPRPSSRSAQERGRVRLRLGQVVAVDADRQQPLQPVPRSWAPTLSRWPAVTRPRG